MNKLVEYLCDVGRTHVICIVHFSNRVGGQVMIASPFARCWSAFRKASTDSVRAKREGNENAISCVLLRPKVWQGCAAIPFWAARAGAGLQRLCLFYSIYSPPSVKLRYIFCVRFVAVKRKRQTITGRGFRVLPPSSRSNCFLPSPAAVFPLLYFSPLPIRCFPLRYLSPLPSSASPSATFLPSPSSASPLLFSPPYPLLPLPLPVLFSSSHTLGLLKIW